MKVLGIILATWTLFWSLMLVMSLVNGNGFNIIVFVMNLLTGFGAYKILKK